MGSLSLCDIWSFGLFGPFWFFGFLVFWFFFLTFFIRLIILLAAKEVEKNDGLLLFVFDFQKMVGKIRASCANDWRFRKKKLMYSYV